MISAVSLTMRYGEKTLFENVSVKFRSGNRYGLIGANGSGKSTFMKILSGQLEASAGEVALDSGCTMGFLRQTIIPSTNKPSWRRFIREMNCYGNCIWNANTSTPPPN